MYDKVQEHWKCYRERLESELRDAPDRDRETLEADIQFMKQTDMGGGRLPVAERDRQSASEVRGHHAAPATDEHPGSGHQIQRLRRPVPHRFRLCHVDDRV